MSRVLLCLLAIAFASSTRACAEAIHIEADTYFTDGDLGRGYAIGVVHCDAATESLAVDGVDYNGEWIKIRVSIPADYCFYTGMRSAGALDYERHFQIEYLTDDGNQTLAGSDLLITPPGAGVT